MKNSAASLARNSFPLLFRTLFVRLAINSWQRLLIAMITISLGTALPVAVRLGTESAKLSLQANLETLGQPNWVGPVRFSSAKPLSALEQLIQKRKFRLVRTANLTIQTNKRNSQTLQLSIEWGYVPFAAQELDRTERELRTPHTSSGSGAADATNAPNSATPIPIFMPKACEKHYIRGKPTQVTWKERTFLAEVKFTSIPAKSCAVGFATGLDLSHLNLFSFDQIQPTEIYIQANSPEDSQRLDTALLSLTSQQAGLQFVSASQQLNDLSKLTKSLNTNLQLMSLVALFVGFFMVNHLFSLIIASNSKQLAILKSLGISHKRIILPLFCLLISLGIASAICGNILGFILGQLMAQPTQNTVAALYDSRISAEQFVWDEKELWIGFGLALTACLAGGAKPLLKLKQLNAAEVLRQGLIETTTNNAKLNTFLLLFTLATVAALLRFPLVYERLPIGAFAACFIMLLGGTIFAKEVTKFLYTFSQRFSGTSHFCLKLRIYLAPSNAITVQVLSLCFALTISVKSMSESFRSSLEQWVNQTLKADLWIRTTNTQAEPFAQSLVNKIDDFKLTGQAIAIDSLRSYKAELKQILKNPNGKYGEQRSQHFLQNMHYDQDNSQKKAIEPSTAKNNDPVRLPIAISGIRLKEQALTAPLKTIGLGYTEQKSLSYNMWQHSQTCLGTVEDPCNAYVSEPLSVHTKLDLQKGVLLKIDLQGYSIWFNATAYYQDFSNDQGAILVDETLLQRFLGKPSQPTFMNLYLKSPQDLETITSQVQQIIRNSGRQDIEVVTLSALRERILDLFAQTFKITDALYLLSALIAFVAVVCTLGLQILLRSKEWCILWANGFSAKKQMLSSAIWAAHLGLWSFIVSLPGSLGTALVLIYVVNYYSFGFSLDVHIPVTFIVGMGFVAWLSGFIGGMVAAKSLTTQLTAKNLSSE